MAGMGFPANRRCKVHVSRVEPRLCGALLYPQGANPQAAGNQADSRAGARAAKSRCVPIL